MNIPLEVVRSIVALPTAIFQVRIDEVTRSDQLVAAETTLIKTQREYIKFLLDPAAAKPTSGMAQKGVSTMATGAPTFPSDLKTVLTTTDAEAAALARAAAEREAPDFGTEFSAVCKLPSTSAGTASDPKI